MTPPLAIEARGVRKRYRGAEREAVAGIDLEIASGTVFGILGPNGAGKTTTLRMLCGLLRPDAGRITIGGETDPTRARGRIGLVPQAIALHARLTARENLDLFGSLYGLRRDEREARAADLLAEVGLAERAGDRVETFSSGMRRRLNLAAGLLHHPDILLLDEPTVGIDPQSRHHILDHVRELGRRGVTVLYTTHYMEEASRICDRVVIMDRGRVLTEAAPVELVARHGTCRVELFLDELPPALADELRAHPDVVDLEHGAGLLTLATRDGAAAMRVLEGVRSRATALGAPAVLRRVVEADLESVFLHLTGRSLRDGEA